MVSEDRLWGGYVGFGSVMVAGAGFILYNLAFNSSLSFDLLAVIVVGLIGYWVGYLFFSRND